jgi:filamentous hemagglutinin family protein
MKAVLVVSRRSGRIVEGPQQRHSIARGARHPLLLATTALTGSLMIAPALAQSLPTGGSVAAGSVSIATPTSTQLNITQSSQSAVVNWQGFSVGQGSAVNIQQPNSSAAILNRVTGNTPTSIAGSLTANGQVYLVNPNGIAITATGVVNTSGGFVASTLWISDADFESGKRIFTGNGASAEVSNAGIITVGRGGYAALIGGTVSNSGSIFVPLGKVGLGSGERATLDFSGDGFLQVALPTAAGGTGAMINNAGSIRVNGGSVIISAATAREAARNAINISGLVQARSIGGQTGSIFIGGGTGGAVNISGRLSATSRLATGGAIAVTGQSIALQGATIDAAGASGGGTINIGGGRQGQGVLAHADTVTIDAQTTIRADATNTGQGGAVVVWSDQLTRFAGTISARGGASSGNGGEAEVSGKAQLAYTGFTDLSATNGLFGTLLLDPYNVYISNDVGNTSGSFTANVDNSFINVGTLQTALSAANVTISTGSSGSSGAQAGNITVVSPLTWATATTLTMNAVGAIAINAPITITGAGGLALTATAQPGVTSTGLTFGNGASVDYGATDLGGRFRLNGVNYKLVYTMAQLDAIDAVNALNGNALTLYGSGLTANYALATDLNATGTTYTRALIGTNSTDNAATRFFGRLDGLGHTITGLTINAQAANYIGLIGYKQDGSVSNLGLVGGSVTGNETVGALIGITDNSIIQQVFASTTVSGQNATGGLIGHLWKMSLVQGSYATGNVTGDLRTGGFAGTVDFGGILQNSYATGTVTGNDTTGGLVGIYSQSATPGIIQTSYASGAVTGVIKTGGLIGETNSNSGAITINSYWDTQTTGVATSAGGTGLTTAQLQGTLPTGFSAAIWGTGTGLYPYLLYAHPAAAPIPVPTPPAPTPPTPTPLTPLPPDPAPAPTPDPVNVPANYSVPVSSMVDSTLSTPGTSGTRSTQGFIGFVPMVTSDTGSRSSVFYEDKRFGP